MVLKNSRLGLNRTILAVVFCTVTFGMSSQSAILHVDSVFLKVFDAELNPGNASFEKLFSKPTVIISNVNCIACTKYFTDEKKRFQFVFILSNESLGEISRIMACHHLSKRDVYFTTCKYIGHLKQALCSGPTPCLIYKNRAAYHFLDYAQLSSVTNEFSLKIKPLKQKLNAGK